MPILTLFVALTAASTPAASAELLYQRAPDFYAQPHKASSLLSKRFGDLLDKEYRCADGVICAIDTDPWTDAQDGEILEPTFKEISRTDSNSQVQMCYQFSLDPAHVKRQCTTIVTVRDSTGRWLIDDLVSPSGVSLQHTLGSFDYGP